MTDTHDLRNQWYDEPVQYEKPMTEIMKNQEILNALNEKIKAAEEALLYLNQSKAGLERVIANSKKPPVEEAYKKVYGVYPIDSIDKTWDPFQAGYNAAYKERVSEVEEEPEKVKTLWDRFYRAQWSNSACDEFCEIVKQWLYDNSTTVGEDHHTVTLKLKKGMLGESND